jgi:hypothetical protein
MLLDGAQSSAKGMNHTICWRSPIRLTTAAVPELVKLAISQAIVAFVIVAGVWNMFAMLTGAFLSHRLIRCVFEHCDRQMRREYKKVLEMKRCELTFSDLQWRNQRCW